MTLLGSIFGIIVIIFGVALLISIIRMVLNFDFNASLFDVDITISEKIDEKQ